MAGVAIPGRARRPARRLQLVDHVWTDLDAALLPLLLVPVGSCEQHGPHLPLDTDLVVAQAVARRAAQRLGPGVLVGPVVSVGASGEHAGFPGTLSIGTPVLTRVLVELVRSGDRTARAVVLVNGHGGNAAALREAAEVAGQEGRRALAWSPRLPGGDAHAGRTETSLLLHLNPQRVRASRPVGTVEPLPGLLPRLRSGGVQAISASGVLGNARGASGAEGRVLLGRLVGQLVESVQAWDEQQNRGKDGDP